jgi:hypothetical protein
MPHQMAIIDAAIKSGVKRFIPSEYGLKTYDDAVVAHAPIVAHKRRYVEYLKSNETSISWTAIITGPFFDWVCALYYH